jgi:hypothetical protein
MLVTLQFPLADSREFVAFDTGKLVRPVWPIPLADHDFIRSFGMVRSRWNGGVTGWIGESQVCDAHNALRFRDLARLALPGFAPSEPLRIAFRRFYSDGLALAKFEVGIALPELAPGIQIQRQAFNRLLDQQVEVPNPPGPPESTKLLQAGRFLARLYLASSTAADHPKTVSLPSWLVQPGNPILILEYRGSKNLKIPYPGKNVSLAQYKGIPISHHVIPRPGLNLRLWAINTLGLDKDETRVLRIALLRLHAEKQVIRQILTNLASKRIDIAPRGGESQALQDYLNEATRKILRLHGRSLQEESLAAAEGQPEEAAVALAFQAEETITAGEREEIRQALSRLQVRKNILDKVGRYVDQASSSTDVEAAMARAGLDRASVDRIIRVLAEQAAAEPLDPKSYFMNLVRALTVPTEWRNEIIGTWTGNTNYDARKLVDWALEKGQAANAVDMVIVNLVDKVRTGLGGDDALFFQGLVDAAHAAAQPAGG